MGWAVKLGGYLEVEKERKEGLNGITQGAKPPLFLCLSR